MEKKITVGDREIVAKELTAEQVAELLEKADEAQKASLAELLMDSPLPLDAVVMSTGLPVEWFAGPVLPSDIKRVWDAAIEVNGFLSGMLVRLGRVAALLDQPGQAA